MQQTKQQFIRMHDLCSCRKDGKQGLLPLSRATIFALVKSGTFPKPVRIGTRAVAWRMSDIDTYLAETA